MSFETSDLETHTQLRNIALLLNKILTALERQNNRSEGPLRKVSLPDDAHELYVYGMYNPLVYLDRNTEWL